MNIFIYQRSFEGLLSIVHDSLMMKIVPDKIFSRDVYQATLFGQVYEVETTREKSDTIWKELGRRVSPKIRNMIYRVFLSEYVDVDILLYRYLMRVLRLPREEATNLRDHDVLELHKVGRKVSQEAMRVIQFARFQRAADDTYVAAVSPDLNVLPLAITHFRRRYADQRWILYDVSREYGFYYDMKSVRQIRMEQPGMSRENGRLHEDVMSHDENALQRLWAGYYRALNIRERKNVSLQVQMMPRRYWKFLPETWHESSDAQNKRMN